MIIQRLADSIRRQDWFVVGIEILIVVIGIFIALQVDDWNQQRKNVALEREYLARMQSEFDHLLEAEAGRLDWNAERIEQAEKLQRALDEGRVPEGEEASIDEGLFLLGIVNRQRLSWGTVEELRSTGNIQLIRDLALRQALTDMENQFRWRDRFLEEAAQISLDYRAELNRHYLIVQPPVFATETPLIIEYDLEDFASNPELRNIIARLAQYQKLADTTMRNNLEQLQDLRDQIAEIRRTRFGDI